MYRRALYLLNLAQNCQDPQIAARLRIIAADYLDCSDQAGGGASKQQQDRSDKEASQGPARSRQKGRRGRPMMRHESDA
jgi:hypothetical protein